MAFHYTGRMPAKWDKLRKRLDVDWRAYAYHFEGLERLLRQLGADEPTLPVGL